LGRESFLPSLRNLHPLREMGGREFLLSMKNFFLGRNIYSPGEVGKKRTSLPFPGKGLNPSIYEKGSNLRRKRAKTEKCSSDEHHHGKGLYYIFEKKERGFLTSGNQGG